MFARKRQLLLMRHAKSSWDDPLLDDFDRPLAARGQDAAVAIGREMARQHWIPQRVLVSPAQRTRATWRLVAEELTKARPEVEFVPALYDAEAEDILAEIRNTPSAVSSLMVVGHNPGLEDLARQLAGAWSEPKALDLLRSKFPTAALARFTFRGDWRRLRPQGARLRHFARVQRG